MRIHPKYLLITHFPFRAQVAEAHQFSPTICRCICFRHTVLDLFFSFFLFIKHCRSHISPRVLMHGVTSAPSSPAIVCEEQCKGRWKREKRENTEGTERAEQKATLHSDFSLKLWQKEHCPPCNARCSNRKNNVLLPDIKIRLITTKQFLRWPSFILCICRA